MTTSERPPRPPSAHIDPADALAYFPDLRALKRWVAWEWTWRPEAAQGAGKWDKPPLDPAEGYGIDQTDEATWWEFEPARVAALKSGRDGVGIALGGKDNKLGIVGIDLDDCIDADGNVSEKARRIVDLFDSYTERTPSGTGLRILIWGVKPGPRCATRDYPDVEIYESDRYLTVSGKHLEGTPATIEHRQEALDALYAEMFPEKPKPARPASNGAPAAAAMIPGPARGDERADADVLRVGNHSPSFAALFGGNWEGQYESQSDADFALCNRLAFYCGEGREDQITRLFLQSALGQREKAARPDYLPRTISRAYQGRTAYFDWNDFVPAIPGVSGQAAWDQGASAPPAGDGDGGDAESAGPDDPPAAEPEAKPSAYEFRVVRWRDGSEVPTEGRNLILIGIGKDTVPHLRLFDGDGARFDYSVVPRFGIPSLAVSTDEGDFPPDQCPHLTKAKWEAFTSFYELVSKYAPPNAPDAEGIARIRAAARTILAEDPPPPEANGKPKGKKKGKKKAKDEDEDDKRPELANTTEVWLEGDGDEEGKTIRVHKSSPDIANLLLAYSGNWPKRIQELLFVEGAGYQPVLLEDATQLFGWIDKAFKVDWRKGATLVTQGRFFEYFRKFRAERYESVEPYPHFPPRPESYYMHFPVTPDPGRTHIDRFLDFFPWKEDVDRSLGEAMLLTLLWGGLAGMRPLFLIQGPDDDPELGRGVGKTSLARFFAEVVGGLVELRESEKVPDLVTRLLSGEGLTRRVVLIDNLKTMKLSWSELEGLITSGTISGHRLYVGEGSRPNLLTIIITMNGGSLSKDMAQRAITIQFSRPAYRKEWVEEVVAFLADYQWDLIAEIAGRLESKGGDVEVRSRWGSWEVGVLAKVPETRACQELIAERREIMDADAEGGLAFEEHVRAKLVERGHDPDTESVRIPTADMGVWYSEFEKDNVPAGRATERLKLLPLPHLRWKRANTARFWLWQVGKIQPVDLLPETFRDEKDRPRRRDWGR
jgi:hypothetical protein